MKTIPTVFVGALGHAATVEKLAVYKAVREFAAFPDGDGPCRANDFGTLSLDGQEYAWKIDYYDHSREFGSDNPADHPSVTKRMLSIFYAGEY